MHNCISTYIRILLLYDECVHYESEMTIMLGMVHDGCTFYWDRTPTHTLDRKEIEERKCKEKYGIQDFY